MDIFIPNWIVSIAISAAFVMVYFAIFTFIFKRNFSWISFAIGIFGVGIGAYFIETFVYYNIFYNMIVLLIFVAPVVEESLKTIGIFYGKKIENGLAIGLGFALAENTVYFVNFNIIYNFSMMILIYMIVRGIMDPAIHSLTAGIDSYFYKKKWYFKFAPVSSILIHMGYNFAAIIIPYVFYSEQFVLYGVIATAVIVALSLFLTFSKNVLEKFEVSNKDIEYINSETGGIAEEKPEIKKEEKKKEEIEINRRSIQSLTESINALNQKYGFHAVINLLNLKYEPYRKTLWIRHAEYSEGDSKGEVYIEIGW
ncbi:MAG: hypothetical protein C0175_05535, partial [Caldisericum exile]